MILPILPAPHPVLNQTAEPIRRIDKRIVKIVRDMTDTLLNCKKPVGVGLAAPQVGIPLQICLIRPEKKSGIQVLINPQITGYSSRLAVQKNVLEGCLSIPKVWGHIERYTKVTVSYLDLAGQPQNQTLVGYPAHIVQHEVDHLRGILFTQKALEQRQPLYTVKVKEGKEEFVPLEV